MVAQSRRQRLTLSLAPLPAAPLVGVACAVLTAALFALIPVATLETLIMRSGIAAVLAAAEPPLGSTARIALILVGSAFVGSVAWFGTFLAVGTRTLSFGGRRAEGAVPVLRRADAHPDAPARAPLFAARELGTPFLDIHAPQTTDDGVEAPSIAPAFDLPDDQAPRPLPIMRSPIDLPSDLDQPLAAYDPAAIPDVPMAPPAPPPAALAPRPQVIDAGERFETFELTPVVRRDDAVSAPMAPRAPIDTRASLTALLERLERGVSDRADRPTPPQEGIEETLGELRRMAMRG